MKILLIAPDYPHPGHPFGGIFNERCATVLQGICEGLELLIPRPFAPPLISYLFPRWRVYAQIPKHEVRNGIPVHRPAYLQIPAIGGAFWPDTAAFVACRRIARTMHRRMNFDAILSFDLIGGGGLAWRIGKDLGIPSSGWATGGDVRYPANSSNGRAAIRALNRLNLVFYQSKELFEQAVALLGKEPNQMPRDRHIVLPRGVCVPPAFSKMTTRVRMRKKLGITQNQILVLSIGRICRDKGIFELIDAISTAATHDPRIRCVVTGSLPAFDETSAVEKSLQQTHALHDRIKLTEACHPEKIWEYLCAADIFAFTSHHEGMPNSLLEAMVMRVPSIAFAIPPVLEIADGSRALRLVPPFSSTLFSDAIVELAASPEERKRMGERGESQVMDRFVVRKNMAQAVERLEEIVKLSE